MGFSQYTTRHLRAFLRILLLILISLAIANQVSASGITYYVDATNGSDANNGLTPEKPWKTINKVNNSIFIPGDSILFKRGETWREKLIVSSSGSAGNPITFGAYGTGAKPKILGSISKNTTGDWMNRGGNMWSTPSVTNDVGHILSGTTVLFSKKPGKVDATTQGDFYYDSAGKTLWMYSTTNPVAVYGGNLELAMDTRPGGLVALGLKEYIIIENLDVRQGGGHGIQTDKASNVLIQDSDVSYVGGAYLYGTTRYGNGIELWDNARTVTVQRCNVSQTFDEGITVQYIDGAGNVTNSDIYIQDNNVDRCGRGMAHSIKTTGTAIGSNIYWRRNSFSNNGLGWAPPGVSNGEGKGAQINCIWNSISNFYFTDNIIETTASGPDPIGQGILLAGGNLNVLRNQVIHTHNSSIRVYSNFTGTIAYNLCHGFDDKPAFFISGQTATVAVYNNVFVKTASANLTLVQLGLHGYPVSNVTVKNNVLADYGTNGWPILCISDDSTATLDNNLYYRGAGSLVKWSNGTTYAIADWAAYKNASGQDGHSPVPQDPKFFSPSIPDFHLLPASPCIDAGVDVGLTRDFEGNSVQGLPDIGAFEFSNGTSSLRASATASPTAGQFPLTVNFTGNATGGTSLYSYSWNFGDGQSSSLQNPAHIYSSAGTYNVVLNVTDSLNASDTESLMIIVTSPGDTDYVLSISSATGSPALGQGGTTEPSPGNYSYMAGSYVLVKSIANQDYRFSRWADEYGNAIGYSEDIQALMDKAKSVSANYCVKCGDVTGDLKISPADAQKAFDIYLKRIQDPTKCELENADVNCSGTPTDPKITPADAQTIFDKFLRKADLPPGDCSGFVRTGTSGSAESLGISQTGEMRLVIDEMEAGAGKDILIPILVASSFPISAFGFDFAFPSDILAFMGIERTDYTERFEQVAANPISEGMVRAGGYATQPLTTPPPAALVTLVFRVIGEAQAPVSFSIFNTCDDLLHAQIRNGIIRRQAEKSREGRPWVRRSGGKGYNF